MTDKGYPVLQQEPPSLQSPPLSPLPSPKGSPRLIVKKTFIEVVEDEDEPSHSPRDKRSVSLPAGKSCDDDPDALRDKLQEMMKETNGGDNDDSSSRVRDAQKRPSVESGGDGQKRASVESGSAFGHALSEKSNSGRRDRAARTRLGHDVPKKCRSKNDVAAPGAQEVESPQVSPQSSRSCSPVGHRFSDASASLGCMSGADSGAESGTEMPAVIEPDPALGPRTTVMFRNLPNNYTRPQLLALLDREGFCKQYDFVYLPMDFGAKSGFGYAFINLADVDTADRFRGHFQGYTGWDIPSTKVADITWSGTHQGYEQHVERYRNSPVMHEIMPDECKPIVLKDGERIDFPPPTKTLRPPRIRPSKNRSGRASGEKKGADKSSVGSAQVDS